MDHRIIMQQLRHNIDNNIKQQPTNK